MIENPHAGEPGSKGVPQGRYMLDHIRKVLWAFIAWEPVSAPRSQPAPPTHSASAFFLNWANALHTVPFLSYRGTAHVD